ncbi:hypothetical protein BpHYR1_048326 [Brachionus plicatilis]|uniref:Uncharacterized protein n=1 Tax=Brachionus plicatilis TaxID=10195 RepID=A0A3M7PE22_BRAPC|nr:hypothetical protein BpHYR1_048326 [Brachionus plicatilis]
MARFILVHAPFTETRVYVRPCTKYPIHGIKACVAKQGDTQYVDIILQPQKPKHNFDAGNKHHIAHVKIFLTYTACVKVVFRVLAHLKCRTKFKAFNEGQDLKHNFDACGVS